ncbi:phage integrase central domain-containing protein [Bradyrhizobium canariense]|uniref:phage integrase central domain-containing protein n=1 Tax=Bradyrhizobium canariense TaxID=255045 RepID=UPI003D9B210B
MEREAAHQWAPSPKRYAYPTIGALTIPEIKTIHVHDLLRPIWVSKRETANRPEAHGKRPCGDVCISRQCAPTRVTAGAEKNGASPQLR